MQYKSLKRVWPDSLLPIWGSGVWDYPPSRVRVWPARLTILHSHSQSHGLPISTALLPKKETTHLILSRRRLHSGYPTREIPCWLFRTRHVPTSPGQYQVVVSTFVGGLYLEWLRLCDVIYAAPFPPAGALRLLSHWAPCLRCTPGWFPINPNTWMVPSPSLYGQCWRHGGEES